MAFRSSNTNTLAAGDDYLSQALAAAKDKEARSLELRVRMTQVRLRPDENAQSDLLAYLQSFAEGRDTADWRDAMQLLKRPSGVPGGE
jgi:hypothetical protein